MLFRRRLMMAQQSRPVRKELEVYKAGEIVGIFADRKWLKTYDGLAIVGWCKRVNDSGQYWCSPIIVSTDFDAATLTINGIRVETYRTLIYEGQLYHCGQLDYSVSINNLETTGRYLINNGEIFTNNPENAAIQAARALLDYYFYKTEA